jgi:hypothetical protein
MFLSKYFKKYIDQNHEQKLKLIQIDPFYRIYFALIG